MNGLFGDSIGAVQSAIEKENMLRQQQFQQALPQGENASIFNPYANAAFGNIQAAKQAMGTDPRMKKAQDMQMIKDEIAKKGIVDPEQKLQAIIAKSTEMGYQETALQAQKALEELQQNRAKAEREQGKYEREMAKPVMDYGDEYEATAKKGFGKRFEELTQQEASQVVDFVNNQRLNKAKASATQVINEAQKKGLGEFGKVAGKQILDSATAINQLDGTINELGVVRDKFKNKALITGGGTAVQKGKQIAFEVLSDLNILTPEEREKLTSTQEIEATLNRVTLDALGGSLGAQISDSDRKFIAKAFGELGQDPKAVVKIYDRLIEVKNREREQQRKLMRLSTEAVRSGDPSVFYEGFNEPTTAAQKPANVTKWGDM